MIWQQRSGSILKEGFELKINIEPAKNLTFMFDYLNLVQ